MRIDKDVAVAAIHFLELGESRLVDLHSKPRPIRQREASVDVDVRRLDHVRRLMVAVPPHSWLSPSRTSMAPSRIATGSWSRLVTHMLVAKGMRTSARARLI